MPTKKPSQRSVIWWIRRDLRLRDNQALTQASQRGDVIPLFILDPRLLESRRTGENRTAFLWGGLRALREDLRRRGGGLILRKGDPRQVLPRVVAESGAAAVFAEEDVSPYARDRDRTLQERVPLTLTPGLMLAPPGEITKKDGDPYQVYSYYMRTWKERYLPVQVQNGLPAPDRFETPVGIRSWGDLPSASTPAVVEHFAPGAQEASNRLERFVGGQVPDIYRYSVSRDRPDLGQTSRLSPYFHFGMLSVREAVAGAMAAKRQADTAAEREGVDTWIEELIWRDFYLSILYHFPDVLRGSFREAFADLPWRNDPGEFQRWKEGKTGYPLVDAGMRQLQQEGWMHNRVRMVAASFLVKHLLTDWRWGETWFMKQLVDADLAANNGGWQWVAGTGTAAMPYFRMFNPVSQAEKHDPHGDYVRRYVPALRSVPEDYVHEPWAMTLEEQEEYDCHIGRDYPAPVVEHSQARERALKAYRQAAQQGEM